MKKIIPIIIFAIAGVILAFTLKEENAKFDAKPTNMYLEDKAYYSTEIYPHYAVTFENLNKYTDEIANFMIHSHESNVDHAALDKLMTNIQTEHNKLKVLFDKAKANLTSDQYKRSLDAVLRYNNIQNILLGEIVKKFKATNSLTENEFSTYFSQGGRKLSQQEIDDLNFLSVINEVLDHGHEH